ncbi:MAG TPA: GTP 3',8-cyclase MoaA, partial [Geobacteraceae bacterium]
NRIRVTASGLARGCLFADESLDLKPLLADDDEAGLTAALRAIVTGKPDRHSLDVAEEHTPFAMSSIGG